MVDRVAAILLLRADGAAGLASVQADIFLGLV